MEHTFKFTITGTFPVTDEQIEKFYRPAKTPEEAAAIDQESNNPWDMLEVYSWDMKVEVEK